MFIIFRPILHIDVNLFWIFSFTAFEKKKQKCNVFLFFIKATVSPSSYSPIQFSLGVSVSLHLCHPSVCLYVFLSLWGYVCLAFSLPFCLSFCPDTVCQFVCLSGVLSGFLSPWRPVCLSVCLAYSLTVWLSVWLSVYRSLHQTLFWCLSPEIYEGSSLLVSYCKCIHFLEAAQTRRLEIYLSYRLSAAFLWTEGGVYSSDYFLSL